MAILDILEYPDPRLRKCAKPVAHFDDDLQQLVDDMFETMYAAPGIGLAATQVNVHKRLLVIDLSDEKDEPLVLINPEVDILDSAAAEYDEGCLSVPGFYETVSRPGHIRVRAHDRNGEPLEFAPEGLLAVCIQHEIDHLDGKLFVDYLSGLKRQRIRSKARKTTPPRGVLRLGTKANGLRIVFAGTPEFSARHLDALLASRHEIAAVYTQPDRPGKRGRQNLASPVKQLALAAQVTVEQPISLREPGAQERLAEFAADVMVVVAYGLILPQAILDTPKQGCINVHASLLPCWRGAAPIERALETGDEKSGVTIMQMEAGLDTGPMLAVSHTDLHPTDTGDSLRERLATLGCERLLEVLDNLDAAQQAAQIQDNDAASYASKLSKAEAAIDWRQSAVELARRIRAFYSSNICFGEISGLRVKIIKAEALTETAYAIEPGTRHSAEPGTIVATDRNGIVVACKEGLLRLTTLQMPGKKALSAGDILNGRADVFAPGQQFSQLNG